MLHRLTCMITLSIAFLMETSARKHSLSSLKHYTYCISIVLRTSDQHINGLRMTATFGLHTYAQRTNTLWVAAISFALLHL